MTSARAAIDAIAELLADAGVQATDEASGFSPSPIGVLIGLPSRVSATLGGETFEIPILVVSGDPVNTAEAVDRLYAEADAIAHAVAETKYEPTTWAGSGRVQPLPAIEIVATVSVSNNPDEEG